MTDLLSKYFKILDSIEYINLEQLENNTGQIQGMTLSTSDLTDAAFDYALKSSKTHPEKILVIVIPYKDNKFIVIKGHHYLNACKQLGNISAPCLVLSNWDLSKINEYIQFHNNTNYTTSISFSEILELSPGEEILSPATYQSQQLLQSSLN